MDLEVCSKCVSATCALTKMKIFRGSQLPAEIHILHMEVECGISNKRSALWNLTDATVHTTNSNANESCW